MPKKRTEQIFIVNHKATKKQQAELDRLTVPLKHLPENLYHVRLTCPICEAVFIPDWFKKHELPLIPVKPKYESKGIEYTAPARWVLHHTSQKCPKCESDVIINIPVNKMRTRGSLFGDDAERSYQNKKVSIYSLIGADQKLLPDIEKSIEEIKQKLFPFIPHDGWNIHMKDMWAGSNRDKHPIFNKLAFSSLISFVGELLELIRKSNLFIYNIAVTTVQNNLPKTSNHNQLRNEAFNMLIISTIDEWTSKNAQPNILFDSEKFSEANKIIHGWARDLFKGSQHTLLYAFLSKCIEIPEPVFVPPASYPGLEIADFVSFIIARYYLRMWQAKEIEIEPKDLGLVTYLGYEDSGDLLWKRQIGYPWDAFTH